MLKIPIMLGNRKYFIHSDRQNFMLGKMVKLAKDGVSGEQYKPESFYSSLSDLMLDILKRKVRQSSATSIEELIQVVKKTEEEIVDVWGSERLRDVLKGET
ncbi:MAG: hypothetical protein DRH06_00360 [Deltaproteobacteria bacterium]|nr:MAG: hypothetical protein DRH06_00360 [Deltaproteobacteria bacterium]